MKKFLLATTFLALSAVTVNAADLPRKSSPVYKPVVSVPKFTWTGFYVGINGGYARQNVGGNLFGNKVTNGGIIGGTVGYNYELQNYVVVGLEGDFGYMGNSGSKVLNGAPLVTGKVDNNYFGTVRGRVGYALNGYGIPLLPYITAGVAFTDTKLSYANSFNPAANFTKTSSTAGFTVGGGLEAQIYQNLTAKIEYLYADFGKERYAAYGKTRVDDHIVRAGLNYKF